MFYHVSLLSSVGDTASHGQADSVSELRQLPAAGGEPRKKALVVRDEQKRARRLRERILQALDAGKVEVVRRLIHDDEMWAPLHAAREQYFPYLARTGRRGGEQASGTRTEAADEYSQIYLRHSTMNLIGKMI